MFKGVYTALITPFKKDKSFDDEAFKIIIEEQIEAGIDGLVAVGTTGESPTVTIEENVEIIKTAVNIAAGRTKIIAGTGSNCTREATIMTQKAAEFGADAALIVCPYYNKPSQKGLILHYQAIAQAVPNLPIILYNVPGRSGVKIEADTIIELSKVANIVGVKNATGNLQDTQDIIDKVPETFSLLSGDDDLTYKFIKMGGHGVISVASNLKPKEILNMVHFALAGKNDEAEKIDVEMQEFFKACFYESNPIPIKCLMAMAGKCEEEYRLPLCPIDDKWRDKLKKFV